MTIIKPQPNDVEFLKKALLELHGNGVIEPSAAEAFLADPACISFLAIQDGHVIGSLYGYALRRPESHRPKFFLYELDVRESHHRKGIGRALVTAFCDEARRQDAQGAWVQAKMDDKRAQAFYRACGGEAKEGDDVLFSFPVSSNPKPRA